MSQSDAPSNPALRELQPWSAPRMVQLRAADAENGIDPLVPDNLITDGS
jgi:hypothetical protein